MNKELRTALIAKGNLVPGLTGNAWYLEAPAKTPHPYAVFSFVANPSSRDSMRKFEQYYLQINIYSEDGEQVEVLKDAFRSEFDDCEDSMSLESWIVDNVEHEFSRASKLDKVYMITLQYKIELTKKQGV